MEYNLFFILFSISCFLLVLKEFLLVVPLLRGFESNYIPEKKGVPVSLIVAARNEAENLRQNLPTWLEQKYIDLELVVVDDRSEDETLSILKAFQQRYSNLEVVHINPQTSSFPFGKKFALSMGIKRASNNKLVFTDADCVPSSNEWLSQMAGKLDENSIVLGASPHRGGKGFFASLARYDTMLIMRQYMGLARLNFPYMTVGRNTGFTKELFNRTGGFKSHMDLASGDDDLFVNRLMFKFKMGTVYHKDALTYSRPKTSFKAWYHQKSRHVSTFARYNGWSKWVLFALGIMRILPLVTFGLLLAFASNHLLWASILIVVSVGVVSLLRWQISKQINQVVLGYFSYMYSFLLGVLYPVAWIAQWWNRQEWRN